MLPSCVGISPSGELLVGETARNQQLVYPERTIRSVKRRMGSAEPVSLGDKTFTPQEISALILRELVEWAKGSLDAPVRRAIITVPAYFSDAQRNATREAGELAGLEVVRIVNEPTAASLAYGYGEGRRRTVMIYDLGGGTFDVSIVTIENDVTEVLASHGNNRLGGDDFNDLLAGRLVEIFREEHGIDLRDEHPAAYSRIWWAAEEAKKRLSFEHYVKVREDALVTAGGKPLHLEVEIARADYEEMIGSLVESTIESVSKAMDDAGKRPEDLDAVILVGGSTRTPLVTRILEERTGLAPRQEIHPDLCVALGAGVLAARLSGEEIDRVLVDVSPFSFGPSYLGDRDGYPYPYCYKPIIQRNTPLPITRSERYCTVHPYQTEVDLEIFQGEDPDALKNIRVGHFRIEGLTSMEEPNEILCRMGLDLDGILHVTAIEKCTGKSKHIAISNAIPKKSEKEMADGRARIESLYAMRAEEEIEASGSAPRPASGGVEDGESICIVRPTEPAAAPRGDEWERFAGEARALVERVRGLFAKLHDEDREEAIDINERVEAALGARDAEALAAAVSDLKELVFFVEGR